MKTIQRSIKVQAPLTETFDEWSHFEDFPQFMSGIDEVQRLDDRHLHWRAHLGGRREEWDTEITEMIPNRVIAWRSTSGAPNAGMVHFEPSGQGGTRLDVRFDYEPHNTLERIEAALGLVTIRVYGDLRRFKNRIENHKSGTSTSTQMHGSELNEGPGM